MTPETETASPAAGRNGRDSSDKKITFASDKGKSNSSNGRRGRGRGGRAGRGGHQGSGEKGGCFNRPANTSSIRNFKVEVEDFARFRDHV